MAFEAALDQLRKEIDALQADISRLEGEKAGLACAIRILNGKAGGVERQEPRPTNSETATNQGRSVTEPSAGPRPRAEATSGSMGLGEQRAHRVGQGHKRAQCPKCGPVIAGSRASVCNRCLSPLLRPGPGK